MDSLLNTAQKSQPNRDGLSSTTSLRNISHDLGQRPVNKLPKIGRRRACRFSIYPTTEKISTMRAAAVFDIFKSLEDLQILPCHAEEIIGAVSRHTIRSPARSAQHHRYPAQGLHFATRDTCVLQYPFESRYDDQQN